MEEFKFQYILQDDRLPYPEWARGYENRILNMSFLIHDAVVKVQNDSVGGELTVI